MKKILYSVMALAIAAMTFTACEDVPEPYPTPVPGQKPVVTYEGEGTLEKPYTVADAINYAKSFGQANSDKAVYIKGFITAVTEEFTTNFGNATFEISDSKDGGNKFIFWRGLYLGNKKYSSGKTQIKVGDEVIICGKVVNYKGNTPETVQGEAFLYSLNGVDEGGGGSDTPAEAKGSGTLEDPFNPAGAVAYAKTLGSDVTSDKDVYIKGKIATIAEEYSTNFGNATFYISEDGEDSNTFYVFRALYLGNRKFKSGDTQIKVGDDVIVCGKVVNFKGNTPETAQNSSYLYSLNGVTEGGDTPDTPGTPSGSGTQADPYNVAKALQVCAEVGEAGTANEVYAKGIVTSITEISTQYGNGTFVISDDATGSNKLTVYRAYSLGNEKFKAENEIKVGDEVVIYGKLVNFKSNTPEFTQGCYIYSLNGKTEGGGGGGGDTPSDDAKGSGTEADPYNAIAAIQYVQALGADKESDKDIYVTGIISSIKYTYSSQYGTATYSISVNGKTANEFTVYGSYYLNNQPWKDGDTQIQLGDEVVVCGKVVNYGGNTPEFANKKNWLVSIKSNGGGGGGDTPGGQGGEVSGNTISVAASSFGLDNQAKLNTLTLTDGTTLTFNGGGNSNTPAFYTAGNGTIRMYPKNSFTINAGNKKIAAIELVCNEYNGTLYNASGNITVEGNKMTVDGTSLKASGINASSATVSNTSEGSGAATQLRIETLKITYAE
ncbi:MAG: hypothetical protein IKQ58_07500 [Prevotella sp.]|nr:hypothetical protein [Prevotella sp.]